MTNAIIGAKGEMAKNLLLPLFQNTVIKVDKGSPSSEWQKAWSADIIWLAVPREAVPSILKGVRLSSSQLIVDICSIKRGLSALVRSTGASFLSLHPLHGPYIPLAGQKWAVIKGEEGKEVLSFLKEQGISFITAESEEEHDFMMGIVLGIPELLTLVIDSLFDNYAKNHQKKKPELKKLIEWATPASNALFSFYAHSAYSSADWLRKDLILKGGLLEEAKKSFADLSKISSKEIEEGVEKQREMVNKLPLEEQKRIRRWIERWFVDANQTYNKTQMKPKIKIQYIKDKEEVFPADKERISVGIHGIEGSFTHESTLRICEELGFNPEKVDFKYLIEGKKVLQAVEDGEIDRGVFCIANSGSGAYVESASAMAKYNFDILAIYGMEILQCLLAHPSIKNINQIKEVFGHPQAISQCKRTFAEKYPGIKLVAGNDADDTALCAKRIKDGELPETTATLASQIAAELYGLNVLEYGMHHDPFNTTTFLMVKRAI